MAESLSEEAAPVATAPIDRQPAFALIDDPSVAFVSFRGELERVLRRLAHAEGLDPGLSRARLLDELAARGSVSRGAVRGLEEFLQLGDRVAHQGLRVRPQMRDWLREDGVRMVRALESLAQPTSREHVSDETEIAESWERLQPSTAHGMENFPVEELEFGVRTYNAVKRAGIETIGDLVSRTEDELAALPSFGRQALDEVRNALAAHGLELRSTRSADRGSGSTQSST